MPPFVIFAHARSGSTSLERVFGLSASVAPEPFHPGREAWYHLRHPTPSDRRTLLEAAAVILRHYDGLRTLDHQLKPELNAELFRMGHPVVFLRRMNVLKAAVSLHLALQTNVWEAWEKRKRKHGIDIRPVNADAVVATARQMSARADANERELGRSGARSMRLTYEALYESPDGVRLAGDAIEFCGVPRPNDDAIAELLSPNHRLGGYDRIPNYRELVDLGSLGLGRLE